MCLSVCVCVCARACHIVFIHASVSGHSDFFHILAVVMVAIERVTGRKARGLQKEEIACKCQTFFLSLSSSRRKQTTNVIFFPFSMQI